MIKIFYCIIILFALTLETFCQENISALKKDDKITLKKIKDISAGDIKIGWDTDTKNPFAPSTIFRFTILNSDSTNIFLLDKNKKYISIIYNGYLLKGHYQIYIPLIRLNPGIYILLMNIRKDKYYRKFIIVKWNKYIKQLEKGLNKKFLSINKNKKVILKLGSLTMQFKLTAFYAFGFLENLELVAPVKVSCSK